MPATSGHRGAWIATGGGIVVLAVAGGLIAGKIIWGGGPELRTDAGNSPTVAPAEAALPDVTAETADATLTYLDGAGKVLIEVTGTKDRLRQTVGAGDAAGCKALTADLNKDFPVDTVLDRLRGMPDPVLGETLSSYWGSALGALDACAGKSDSDDYLADANDSLTLVDKRMAQLKDAR
jgi:hypothetical protein